MSIFFRACVQGPEVFAATLGGAQYADELFQLAQGSPSASKWATEGLVEHVRIFRNGNRPARHESIFVFQTAELAQRFIAEFRKESPTAIYQCSVDAPESMFIGDMNLFTEVNTTISHEMVRQPISQLFPTLTELAGRYWAAKSEPEWPEVLVKGGTVMIQGVI